MKMYSSIDIDAPPEAIWPLIADPAAMAAWHERLVSVNRPTAGSVRLGERFGMTYSMSGRQGNVEAEVLRCQPPVELTWRQRFRMNGREGQVDESFDLVPRGSKTRVRQTVDFSKSGIPWWGKLLMWLTSRFGRAVDPSMLRPLKERAEAAVAAS